MKSLRERPVAASGLWIKLKASVMLRRRRVVPSMMPVVRVLVGRTQVGRARARRLEWQAVAGRRGRVNSRRGLGCGCNARKTTNGGSGPRALSPPACHVVQPQALHPRGLAGFHEPRLCCSWPRPRIQPRLRFQLIRRVHVTLVLATQILPQKWQWCHRSKLYARYKLSSLFFVLARPPPIMHHGYVWRP